MILAIINGKLQGAYTEECRHLNLHEVRDIVVGGISYTVAWSKKARLDNYCSVMTSVGIPEIRGDIMLFKFDGEHLQELDCNDVLNVVNHTKMTLQMDRRLGAFAPHDVIVLD